MTTQPLTFSTVSSRELYVERSADLSTPQWRWSIAPGCYFVVRNAPNRFHRFMQRVFLGLKWERNP
jgi:hypothetical protein